MLQIPTWLRVFIGLILLGGILIALPNALPANVAARMPSFMSNTVALGLDLQGGSSILEEVELDQALKDKIESLHADVRIGLRKAHIGFENLEVAGDDTIHVRILDPSRFEDAKTILNNLNPVATSSLLGGGARAYDLTTPGSDTLVMKMTDAYKTQTSQQIVSQSIEVVRRRIDALGTREPDIARQGEDRILIEVPGLSDPQRLIDLLGKTAKMTFQLVDETANPEQAAKGIVPVGDELLYEDTPTKGGPPVPIVVQRRVMVSGDRLVDSAGTFSQSSGQPVVTMRFDSVGAREFADMSRENVGRRFAIVLDNKVLSAPVFREPILGGSGEIEGSFTIQSATDLAALLRAGALPAPLKVIEQRTVGAELGADSITAGKYSAIGGLLLVGLFMIARYGLFGVFADVALAFNIILLFAALTLFGATLTLPGIAGIVLTMGMAVDANVLIYERIKEEQRNGRSMLASIDTGFRRAMTTIIDANATHVIASIILFELGSGPVRGFAVTLLVGIITSFFTAVMVTRLLVVGWLELRQPKRLAI
ncbi:MAG TPA: protein translocase subunit SecD [Rhizomicrobium sp.]|jgi:SecD/SecF fusion protein